MLIGLTGSVASGKSLVASIFRLLGFYVIDADKVVAHIYDHSKEAFHVVKIFFPDALDGSKISKTKILHCMMLETFRFKIFLCVLYKIVLKKILHEYNQAVKEEKIIILDAPTLFESGFNIYCDKVVSVSAPLNKRVSRCKARELASSGYFDLLESMQISEEEKNKASNFLIKNDKSIMDLFSMCKELKMLIKSEKSISCPIAKRLRDNIN